MASRTLPIRGGRQSVVGPRFVGPVDCHVDHWHAVGQDPHAFGNEDRFANRSPLGYAGGDVNLYRYVGNGPVTATDPGGLDAEDAGTDHPKPQTNTQGGTTFTTTQLFDAVRGSPEANQLLGEAHDACGHITPWFEKGLGPIAGACAPSAGADVLPNGDKIVNRAGDIMINPSLTMPQALVVVIFELANLAQASQAEGLQNKVKNEGMSLEDYQVKMLVIESRSYARKCRILDNNATKWGMDLRALAQDPRLAQMLQPPPPGYRVAAKNGPEAEEAWAKKYYAEHKNDRGEGGARFREIEKQWGRMMDKYRSSHPPKESPNGTFLPSPGSADATLIAVLGDGLAAADHRGFI